MWNWGPWAECAVLTAAIVPYTMITMGEGIKKLQSVKVAEGGDAKGDWVVREVKKWGKLNMYRAGFHGAAVAVGIWAIAKGMERK